MSLNSLIPDLIAVSRQAGAAIMAIHARGPSALYKSDGSPVTQADQAAEDIILPVLKDLRPDIHIISEENAASHTLPAPEKFWLVDPLDGTKEFLKADGQGAFTVNIAMIEGGVPVLGLVYAPALDRLFVGDLTGYRGQALTQESGTQRDLRIRPVPKTGPVAVASASHRDAKTETWLHERGLTQTRAVGSSLKFCLIAAGEADVYPRFGPTMEWDTAAGDAVLRAAGGKMETLDARPYVYGKAGYRNTPFIARGAYHV